MRRLIEKFKNSSAGIKVAVAGVIAVWAVVFMMIVVALLLVWERPSVAQEPTLEATIPTITLEPSTGLSGTLTTIHGVGWPTNSIILIYLTTPEQIEIPEYAITSVLADAQGRFMTTVTIPTDSRWETTHQVKIIARAVESGMTTHAFFNLVSLVGQSIETSTEPEPTATPTLVVQESIPTPQPGVPLVTAKTNVNIRSGPGTVYPVVGLLQTGQSIEVTGLSPDRAWWQIKFEGIPEGRGWVSAGYVTAQNTDNLPIVQLVVLPPMVIPSTPMPTPMPVIITEWRGEYFDNPHLNGAPVLVRNDPVIQFSWGPGSPGPGVPADNFSIRWTRDLYFSAGTYRFKVLVDDGVRLWVDNNLIIDCWYPTDPRSYTAEMYLSEGTHRLRLEYFEFRYDAQVRLDWERKEEIVNRPPQAVPGGPYTVNEGSVVTLDGRGSRDPDGSVVNYEWDFNYNGRDFTVDATGPVVNTRYPDGPATVVIALRVTDNKGTMALATAQVAVQNVAPTVKAGGPYSGLVGSMITLAGSAADPGSIDQTGLIYRWEFGDGAGGGGPVAGHSYARAGTYTAKLTVIDKDGARGSDTATVQVTAPNQPPLAVINGPTKGLVGEVLNFSGSGSNDKDGSIVGYVWDFGNGKSGSGVNVSHSYNAANTYQVTLTVTDNGGLTSKATHTVQIEQPTPPPVNLPPSAVISGPAAAQVGQTVQFSGSGSSDDGSIVGYVWDFGDGASDSGMNVSHVYTQSGTYKVVLTVTDNGGLTANAEHVIQINEMTNGNSISPVGPDQATVIKLGQLIR